VASYYEQVKALGVPDDVVAAVDIMVDDGVPVQTAATFAVAAHRRDGNAEAWARHFVKLRKAARE
jgi:hypothetical protein